MAPRRKWAVATAWFLLGLLAGVGAILGWQRYQARDVPARRLEATVYLPMTDNHGRNVSDAVWDEALGLLVKDLGGATVGPPLDGYWRDDEGRLCREPVRPVIVSFEPSRLAQFRQTLKEVGRRLGQQVLYTRFEQPRVELLFVDDAPAPP